MVKQLNILNMALFNFNRNQRNKPGWASKLPKEIADMMLNEIKSNPQACNLDEIPQGKGKFGLESSNPIPIYGVPANEDYLNRLVLKDGGKIRWRRVGSMSAPNIEKPIDKYEVFDKNGNTVCFIYLSPYHLKNSRKAPEGFRFN
jgi:hypothetical protein